MLGMNVVWNSTFHALIKLHLCIYFFSAEEKNPSHDNRKYSTAVDDIEYLPAAHCHVYLKVLYISIAIPLSRPYAISAIWAAKADHCDRGPANTSIQNPIRSLKITLGDSTSLIL